MRTERKERSQLVVCCKVEERTGGLELEVRKDRWRSVLSLPAGIGAEIKQWVRGAELGKEDLHDPLEIHAGWGKGGCNRWSAAELGMSLGNWTWMRWERVKTCIYLTFFPGPEQFATFRIYLLCLNPLCGIVCKQGQSNLEVILLFFLFH